jgi:hypothetical protein
LPLGGRLSSMETPRGACACRRPGRLKEPRSIQGPFLQDGKAAFVNGAVDRKTVNPDRLENSVSRYVIQAGPVIPAALITGIRSDLLGPVTAQVTENVYDSPTGRYLLIPQGSKLIGACDSQVSYGQNRLLLVWTRLIIPNGRSVVLERQPGADPQGFIGLDQYGTGSSWAAPSLAPTPTTAQDPHCPPSSQRIRVERPCSPTRTLLSGGKPVADLKITGADSEDEGNRYSTADIGCAVFPFD